MSKFKLGQTVYYFYTENGKINIKSFEIWGIHEHRSLSPTDSYGTKVISKTYYDAYGSMQPQNISEKRLYATREELIKSLEE